MKLEVDIECPGCKRKLKIKVENMRPGQKMRCLSCNSEIRFSGDNGRKAQRAIDDFEETLKKMFK